MVDFAQTVKNVHNIVASIRPNPNKAISVYTPGWMETSAAVDPDLNVIAQNTTGIIVKYVHTETESPKLENVEFVCYINEANAEITSESHIAVSGVRWDVADYELIGGVEYKVFLERL